MEGEIGTGTRFQGLVGGLEGKLWEFGEVNGMIRMGFRNTCGIILLVLPATVHKMLQCSV